MRHCKLFLRVSEVATNSVTLTEKSRKTLLGLTTVACGILGLILLRWTPTTGSGILAYVVLFAVLVVMAIALSSESAEDTVLVNLKTIESSGDGRARVFA
jgi:hypothetical protein